MSQVNAKPLICAAADHRPDLGAEFRTEDGRLDYAKHPWLHPAYPHERDDPSELVQVGTALRRLWSELGYGE